MADDKLAALEEIRQRAKDATMAEVLGVLETERARRAIHKRSAKDVPRLLAVVDALLKDHQPGRNVVSGSTCNRHEAHRHFSITDTEAADVRDCPDCKATVYVSCTGCGPQVSLDQCPVRKTITRELTGEGKSDG